MFCVFWLLIYGFWFRFSQFLLLLIYYAFLEEKQIAMLYKLALPDQGSNHTSLGAWKPKDITYLNVMQYVMFVDRIWRAVNVALCDRLEPVLLVLMVALCNTDYILHYSTVHSWINILFSDKSKITNIPYLAYLINYYRYLEGLSYLAFRKSLKNYNTHKDISHPGKLYFVQWRVPIFIQRLAIQCKIKMEKEKYKFSDKSI